MGGFCKSRYSRRKVYLLPFSCPPAQVALYIFPWFHFSQEDFDRLNVQFDGAGLRADDQVGFQLYV